MSSIRIKMGLSHIEFDKKGFNKTFDAGAKSLIYQAAQEWFRFIITKIPVWTGMALGGVVFARGTNGFLYRYLKQAMPIQNPKSSPKWYRHSDGTRVRKIPQNGGRFSRYSFASAQKRYTFYFRSDIIHFIINDFFNSPIPTQIPAPWHSIAEARKVFRDYLSNNRVRLIPKMKNYIFFTQATNAGGSATIRSTGV